MGVLTNISVHNDEENEQIVITAITRFQIAKRPTLNRVANRASVGEGVGQRTLVAAAYDELGIDLVWSEGPFGSKKPEEKYPDAKKIEFYQMPIDRASDFGDITGVDPERLGMTKIIDLINEWVKPPSPDAYINVWKIPYELTNRR
jgi:hypothetical protein